MRMNKIMLIGNVASDPEKYVTSSGANVCNFNLAVNQRIPGRGDNGDTEFFRISAWRGLGDICEKYIKKGNKIAVSGSIRGSAYISNNGTAKYSLDVTASEIEFLTPKSKRNEEPPKELDEYGFTDITGEPLPF